MHSSALIVQLAALGAVEDMDRAVEIAALGMLMVFAALTVLCAFLALLPRVLAVINTLWPEASDHRAAPDGTAQMDDDDDVLAAIGFILYSEIGGQR